MAVVREKQLQRAQAEKQLGVVAVTPRHIAEHGKLLRVFLGPGGIGVLALVQPDRISAIDP